MLYTGRLELLYAQLDGEDAMLKKAKAAASAPATDVKDLPKAVLDSSRQIWLAGLGAFSRAQAEGTKVFETLVKQGEAIESRTRRAATDTAAAARDAAQAKAKEMQKMAGGTWDKLEKVFEDRVARALSRLGVHTQKDVDRLAARVDALSEAVNELIKANGGVSTRRRARPAGAPAARKTAKKAAPKTAAGAGRKAAK
jgi:poly(hydroxyalkanoate) granule-associated protein